VFYRGEKLDPRVFYRVQKLDPRVFYQCQKLDPRVFYQCQKLDPRVFYQGQKLDPRVFYRGEKYVPYIPRVLSQGPYARAFSSKWHTSRAPPDFPSSEVRSHMPRDQSESRVQFEELSQRTPYRVACKIINSK
jgi:hypothetical protein